MEDGLRSKLLDNDEISLEFRHCVQNFTSGHSGSNNSNMTPGGSLLDPMHLVWENINVRSTEENTILPNLSNFLSDCLSTKQRKPSLPSNRLLLNNVSGVAKAGEILAIMGSSGAGKTTLLNVLTGRNLQRVEVDGSVRVMCNGINLNEKGAEHMKHVCSYVQQDDLFVGTMTVMEHLTFVTRLKMGRNLSNAEVQKHVDNAINELGLNSCANTQIGWPHRLKGISGGERKRLAFAAEILTSPPLLFCDEPTSGLDAFLAQQVVHVLSQMAKKKGMTIVLTIHQPSSQIFELFDKICLLVEGRLAFLGTTAEATELWSRCDKPLPLNFNPGDHFIATLSSPTKFRFSNLDRSANICDIFTASKYGRRLEAEVKELNEDQSTSTRESRDAVIQSFNQRKQYQAGLVLLCDEYHVFMREHGSGTYRVDTYFLSKNIAELLQYILYPIVFSSIVYWMSGLYRTFEAFSMFTLSAILMTNVAYAFSCIFARVDVAVAVLPIYVIPLLAFGGFFINQMSLPAYFLPLKYLSYFGFTFENMVINEWRNIESIPGCDRFSNSSSSCYDSGMDVISSLSFQISDVLPNILALIAMILGFRVIALVALSIRAKCK